MRGRRPRPERGASRAGARPHGCPSRRLGQAPRRFGDAQKQPPSAKRVPDVGNCAEQVAAGFWRALRARARNQQPPIRLGCKFRALRGSQPPRSETQSPRAAAPASIYIFSLLYIRTNVLLLNLHKTHAEISLFYLNSQSNIFVAFGTLWWYN